MNPERWQKVEAVFQQAIDLSPLERGPFLDNVCAGDHELRDETDSLIAAFDEAGGFMEEPAMAQDAHVLLGETDLGREIGPYRIISQLGAGGMAEVYLAQDTRLNRLVALKLLPSYFASDEIRLRRFQSEARAASALNHPSILTIYEVGEDDGVYFIATEFIDGQTIRELIKQQQLTLDEVLDVVEQVASALSVAHAAGIVHRDIKPENIMRRRDGLLKILDFGVAKLSEPDAAADGLNGATGFRTTTEAGLVMGTVSYMSPEQARGLVVDERTDIWSLGVVLYEMLSWRLPFSGATKMDTMVAILDREPAPLDISKPRLQSIVQKCLSKETADRYRTVGDLLSDLKAAREETDEVGPVVQTSSRRVWSIAGLVLLLIAATVGISIYRQSRTTNSPAVNTIVTKKLYAEMNEQERVDFVAAQEQRISAMMSDRPVKLNAEAVSVIKKYVDRYFNGINDPSKPDGEGTKAMFERAPPYVPLIARSFADQKVPIIIGIYLPVVESGYQPCYESPLGSNGLYQFLPSTAKIYGIPREDMCDAEKMTPAAARYIADHMAELGEDSESVTLVLVSHNRGAQWVRNTLRQLRATENYERNFWTLLANAQMLDESFRRETAGYVPSFFAAAIIGENPEAFGLNIPPLSTLAK